MSDTSRLVGSTGLGHDSVQLCKDRSALGPREAAKDLKGGVAPDFWWLTSQLVVNSVVHWVSLSGLCLVEAPKGEPFFYRSFGQVKSQDTLGMKPLQLGSLQSRTRKKSSNLELWMDKIPHQWLGFIHPKCLASVTRIPGSEILFYLLAEQIIQKMPLFSGRGPKRKRRRKPKAETRLGGFVSGVKRHTTHTCLTCLGAAACILYTYYLD